jgi:hypothetical protein
MMPNLGLRAISKPWPNILQNKLIKSVDTIRGHYKRQLR